MSALSPIDFHIRSYRMLLKSAGELDVNRIVESHIDSKPLLHEKAKDSKIDTSAFIYSLLRLPDCMSQIKRVILGQSYSVFKKNGWSKMSRWKEVTTPGRRRKIYWDGKDTLAMYIASVSDVDDVITLLTAFQIEWNKFHQILKDEKNVAVKASSVLDPDDLQKIQKIWGADYHNFLTAIKHRQVDVTVKLLAGSYSEYVKATNEWWHHIENSVRTLHPADRPIYFISSNTHSVVNILSRFVKKEEPNLLDYLARTKDTNLQEMWKAIESGSLPIFREHFLYYLSKKYSKFDTDFLKRKKNIERSFGIHQITSGRFLDIDAQVIELSRLKDKKLDERIGVDTRKLHKSEALIVNVDYPLGWAAYQVLTAISHRVDSIRGIYIMGKAAGLVGEIGDILIPNTIYDQHSKNLYTISNAFSRNDFKPIYKTGSVFDNLKTMTVKGTFLQSEPMIRTWYQSGYNSIEMEAGPYLNAVYELIYYNRYEEQQTINLTNHPTTHTKKKLLLQNNFFHSPFKNTKNYIKIKKKHLYQKN
jgi:hypothetical protein